MNIQINIFFITLKWVISFFWKTRVIKLFLVRKNTINQYIDILPGKVKIRT